MPIYEYQCQKCGEVFEVFQKVSDPPPKKHSCGSRRIRRVMSQTSFILKGTGWYVTDYARKGQNKDGHKNGHKNESDGSKSKKNDSKDDGSKKGDSSGKKEKSRDAA